MKELYKIDLSWTTENCCLLQNWNQNIYQSEIFYDQTIEEPGMNREWTQNEEEKKKRKRYKLHNVKVPRCSCCSTSFIYSSSSSFYTRFDYKCCKTNGITSSMGLNNKWFKTDNNTIQQRQGIKEQESPFILVSQHNLFQLT